MGSIEKRTLKDGRIAFYCKVRLKGSRPRAANFTRLTDARLWIQRTEADIKRGRFIKDTRTTVAEAIDRYMTDVLPDKARQTIKARRTHLRWWRERIGHLFLNDVRPAMIGEGRDALIAEGKQPATVGAYLMGISTVFRTCVREWEIAETNPCVTVRRPTLPPNRVRFLTEQERTRLLAACQESSNRHLYAFVVVLMLTGMRKAELLNLRWGSVDFEQNTISLTAAETKTRAPRVIPMSSTVRETLARRKADAQSLRVFPMSNLDYPWRIARQAAGLDNFVIHDLRHDCASSLARGGASLHEIAEVLGHRNLGTTRRYSHLTKQHLHGVLENLDARTMKNGSGKPSA